MVIAESLWVPRVLPLQLIIAWHYVLESDMTRASCRSCRRGPSSWLHGVVGIRRLEGLGASRASRLLSLNGCSAAESELVLLGRLVAEVVLGDLLGNVLVGLRRAPHLLLLVEEIVDHGGLLGCFRLECCLVNLNLSDVLVLPGEQKLLAQHVLLRHLLRSP